MNQKIKRKELLDFRPGEVIAEKYELISVDGVDVERLRPLGEGGTGVVFKARHALHADVTVFRAIKFYVAEDKFVEMKLHADTAPMSVKSFNNEIINLSGFNHQNILKVIEAGIWRSKTTGYEVPFIITDYVEGWTLRDALADESFRQQLRQQPYILIDIILQICRGISHLHARNFFHCDIAPKNIFLQGDGPEYQVVIGDLGTGRTIKDPIRADKETTFIVGSVAYCPEEVRELINKEISFRDFSQLQPYWDIFAVAKTAIDLISSIENKEVVPPAWLSALKLSVLNTVKSAEAFKTIKDLEHRVRLLHPMQHTIWEVQELSENSPKAIRELLPIEPVSTSSRIRKLIRHPALVRLKRVPQLMMATKMLYSGNHDRYEHSLGVYQSTRRYLLALLNDDEFLSFFEPNYIELALVASLLSNITRFPFSTMIHELHTKDRKLFDDFTRAHIFDELLDDFGEGKSLGSLIEQYFPNVDKSKLKDVLTTGHLPHQDPSIRFIKQLFNSSIDVRGMDYMRRDSHHVGIFRGDVLDLGDLLPHIRFKNHELVLRATGLTVIEQVITLRYWLFIRVYWNRPNRTVIAMVRSILLSLRGLEGFQTNLRKKILSSSEEELLEFFEAEAHRACMPHVQEICKFLLRGRPHLYMEILQFNRAEGDANARMLCDRYENLSLVDSEKLHKDLNELLVETFNLEKDRIHVLLDVPMEYGPRKLGEDLNIETYNGEITAVLKLSGIIEGVQKGFTEHIQRLRVFIHPDTYLLFNTNVESLIKEVREFLVQLG
jgi:uncharacterized protein